MLAYDFIRISDTSEIRDFVPMEKLSKVEDEMLDLSLGQIQAKFTGRSNKEIAQFTFLFHVEQLREMK